MVSTNRTGEFRELCKAQSELPNRKQKQKRSPEDANKSEDKRYGTMYLGEAYAILKHVNTLTNMLSNVRRPYLNVDSQPTYARQSRTLDLSPEALSSGESWSGLRYLTNEERDQIDLQSRLILSKCAERVREMELLEKRRAEAAAAKVNPLIRLLPTRLTASDDVVNAEFIASHRSNITWYLTRRLAEASQHQKEIQEERLRRQVEKAKTLGSTASPYDPYSTNTNRTAASQPKSATSALSSFTSTFMRSTQATDSLPVQDAATDDSDDDELELSPEQIQQFEEENSALLKSVEDTLQAVQLAETRLLEISTLQTELVVQLARQTEMVEHLYDEAITTQGQVEKGHIQLKQARERAKSSRKWLLAFTLGATLAILFLHWYD